jgi:hypothetical protein
VISPKGSTDSHFAQVEEKSLAGLHPCRRGPHPCRPLLAIGWGRHLHA